MESCQCDGIESKFDREYVRKKLEDYRAVGPKKTTQVLIEAIATRLLPGMTLLDIGGGVGDIQHALLGNGQAGSAISVEASSAYNAACREEAARQGHGDRIRYLQGNFVDIAGEVPEADIVTLDRVICCYHDMETLVQRSAEKAGVLYGAVYPRDTWWVRWGSGLVYNLRFRLQGNPMRIFVHPTRRIEEIVRQNGLQRVFQQIMGTWEVVLFSR